PDAAPTPMRGSLVKNVSPMPSEIEGSGRESGATIFKVALGELTVVHRSNECKGVSRSVLSKPISSLRHPKLKRSQDTRRPFMETYGLRKFSVTSFAVIRWNGP